MGDESLFSFSALSHALAGAAGAEVATLAFYPLELILTRLQTAGKRIYTFSELTSLLRTEGVLGLYQGLIPNMEAVLASNLTYFYSYHATKRIVRLRGHLLTGARAGAAAAAATESPLVNLLVGAFAATINIILTTPLWVANTRLKLQRKLGQGEQYRGLLRTVRSVARDEGVSRLWGSLVPSMLLICNPAIHFAVYESIKSRLLRGKSVPHVLTARQAFLLGAFAKICATIVTYPIQVAQSRLRTEQERHSRAYQMDGKSQVNGNRVAPKRASLGTVELMLKLYREEGLESWYRGIGVKLTQSTLTAALMFLVYERVRGSVLRLLVGRAPAKIA